MLDRVLGWWSLLARFSRVECYFLSGCLLGVLFAFGYDMGAGYALEERVYRGAGRSRRRARGDGVCSCGAGSPSPVFVVARRRVFSRGRGSDVVIFLRSVARSTAFV